MASSKFYIFGALLVGILVVLTFSTYHAASRNDGLLKIHVFDVGHGDAVLVESPTGHRFLIDGGSDVRILARLGETLSVGQNVLDAVVATRFRDDALAGLVNVLGRYRISYAFQASTSYTSPVYETWRGALGHSSTQVMQIRSGKVIDLGDGVILHILSPDTLKDDRIILMLQYKNFKILMAQAVDQTLEHELVSRERDLRADALIVGDHGSKNATTDEFLQHVMPSLAVISVDAKNKDHAPAPSVLKRLENFGATVYRTDINGSVELVSDGSAFTARLAKP